MKKDMDIVDIAVACFMVLAGLSIVSLCVSGCTALVVGALGCAL